VIVFAGKKTNTTQRPSMHPEHASRPGICAPHTDLNRGGCDESEVGTCSQSSRGPKTVVLTVFSRSTRVTLEHGKN